MPFSRTWTEEIVAEWLHLEGYLVEANMPIAATPAGGRLEVDVIGAKIRNEILDIVHAEVGVISGGPDSIRTLVRKKFSSDTEGIVTSYFKERFAVIGTKTITYRKMYVATWSGKLAREELRRVGVEVLELHEFLKKLVLPTIQHWKENPSHHPKFKGKSVALPDSYWLLLMLEYLDRWGMIRIENRRGSHFNLESPVSCLEN